MYFFSPDKGVNETDLYLACNSFIKVMVSRRAVLETEDGCKNVIIMKVSVSCDSLCHLAVLPSVEP